MLGVWVTARARQRLQKGIDLVGINFVYCDTDSVKYIHDDSINWDVINEPVRKEAIKNGNYAEDSCGEKFYVGVFESEPHVKRFKTMGAKKYAYIDDKDALHITIAGVNKKIGAVELERAAKKHNVKYGPPVDPLFMMDEGFKFIYAGGLEVRYSDFPEIDEWTTEDGVPIRITRNVSLVENTKTLGLTGEYRELLERFKRFNVDL